MKKQHNFVKISSKNIKEIEPLKGIFRKTLVYDDNLMMIKFRLEKGSNLPIHSHPHQQMGYIVEGKLEFIADGNSEILIAGDSYMVKGNVEHGANVLENSIVIDIFSPKRDDYL